MHNSNIRTSGYDDKLRHQAIATLLLYTQEGGVENENVYVVYIRSRTCINGRPRLMLKDSLNVGGGARKRDRSRDSGVPD